MGSTLFLNKATKPYPFQTLDFNILSPKRMNVGDTIRFSVSSYFDNYFFLNIYSAKNNLNNSFSINNEIINIEYVIKEEDRGKINITGFYVKNNELNKIEYEVYVPFDNKELKFEFETPSITLKY